MFTLSTLRFSRGWVRKDGNLVMETGCTSPFEGGAGAIRSISEISSCFFGPRPWHIEIRHRVKKTSTINLFGFETLKLKIRRLKLWKPTVSTSNYQFCSVSRRAAPARGKSLIVSYLSAYSYYVPSLILEDLTLLRTSYLHHSVFRPSGNLASTGTCNYFPMCC